MPKLYLDHSKVIEMKRNVESNIDLYKESESWLGKELDLPCLNPANLVVSNSNKRSADDLANAIRLYEYYKDLSYTLASDQNFWTLLTHIDYWDYMRQRWPIEEAQGDQVDFIKTRYFFGQKSMYRNGLSRLWWYVELTYDDNLVDPYTYTKLLLEDQDLAAQTIENKYLARNKVAMRALFEMLDYVTRKQISGEIQKLTGDQRRKLVRNIAKYFNLSGAVHLWDILSPVEAKTKLITWVDNYLENLGVLTPAYS